MRKLHMDAGSEKGSRGNEDNARKPKLGKWLLAAPAAAALAIALSCGDEGGSFNMPPHSQPPGQTVDGGPTTDGGVVDGGETDGGSDGGTCVPPAPVCVEQQDQGVLEVGTAHDTLIIGDYRLKLAQTEEDDGEQEAVIEVHDACDRIVAMDDVPENTTVTMAIPGTEIEIDVSAEDVTVSGSGTARITAVMVCPEEETDAGVDGGGGDGGADAGVEDGGSGGDGGIEIQEDAGVDGGGGMDGGIEEDAGSGGDGGADAGLDGGVEEDGGVGDGGSGGDGGMSDGGMDAGPDADLDAGSDPDAFVPACGSSSTGIFHDILALGTPMTVGGYVFTYLGEDSSGSAIVSISCGGSPVGSSPYVFPEDTWTEVGVPEDGKMIRAYPLSCSPGATNIEIRVQEL